MEFSSSWMICCLLFGSLGYGLFIYGKKQGRPPQLIAGIAMMLYPSFVSSPLAMVAIGVALVGGLWAVVRCGW